MSYFHIHKDIFSPGDEIENGAMGKMLDQYVLFNNSPNNPSLIWRLYQELTFELIREKEFPNKPSRLRSIFLFDSLNDTKDFLQIDKREGENIYEVEIVEKDKSVHKASMKLYERIPMGRPTKRALEDQARQYWKGIDLFVKEFKYELLVESPVKVIKQFN